MTADRFCRRGQWARAMRPIHGASLIQNADATMITSAYNREPSTSTSLSVLTTNTAPSYALTAPWALGASPRVGMFASQKRPTIAKIRGGSSSDGLG